MYKKDNIKVDNVKEYDIRAYSQTYKPNAFIFEMSHESSEIYNMAMKLHSEGNDFKAIGKTIYNTYKPKYLIAQSLQGSYEAYINDFKNFTKALKAYKANPSNFNGQPKPPHKEKYLRSVIFKEEAIRRRNGYLLLSVKKPFEPIRIKWGNDLPIPKYITISYDYFTGWKINMVCNTKNQNTINKSEGVMSIDLGVKRIATTCTPVAINTYSGKEFLALGKLRNKLLAKTQSTYANTGKESRRRKYLKRAYRTNVRKIKNKEKDILHKYARRIVNDAIGNNINTIVIGNNSSTHKDTNLGKANNQKITQNPEQKLKEYIRYKFESVGGKCEIIPEYNTSRTCPSCNHIKDSSPKGRVFKCDECGFVFDRDGVGAINIYNLYINESASQVSFGLYSLDVIGRMTLPLVFGVKYRPNVNLSFRRDLEIESV